MSLILWGHPVLCGSSAVTGESILYVPYPAFPMTHTLHTVPSLFFICSTISTISIPFAFSKFMPNRVRVRAHLPTCACTPTHVCAHTRTMENVCQSFTKNYLKISSKFLPIIYLKILPKSPPLQSPQNPCNFDSIRVHESCPKSMPNPYPKSIPK